MRVLTLLAVVACSHPAPATVPTTDPDAPKIEALAARCEQANDPDACNAAAVVLDHRGDAVRARNIARRGISIVLDACERHLAAASCRLASAHLKLAISQTTGDKQPLIASLVSTASTGCLAGELDLCLDAAAILARGEAGPADPDRARVLVEHACEGGEREACVDLGVMLSDDPRASTDDHVRASALLERACSEHARGDGCAALATVYLRATHDDDARRTAARACMLGDAGGCAIYGHCLSDGIGGPVDRGGAVRAFHTACDGGDQRGCQMVTALAPK